MKSKLWVVVVSQVVALTVLGANAQDAKSPASAVELVRLLEQAKLESFAVKDAREADRYMAVLYIPNVQLLTVSSRYPVPAALDVKIASKGYRDVYLDLTSSTSRAGRFFVMDLQADGLRPRPQGNKSFDIIFENVVSQTTFDGDWKKQKLSEREYRDRFTGADARYAEMLDLLIAGLKPPPAP